jgi:hypothetical protein
MILVVASEASDPTEEQTDALTYLRSVVAKLGLYEYAKIGGVQFTENGMHRMETETYKSAYKYQENQYKDWMLNNGYTALELFLEFLEDNEDDYPLWKNNTTVYNKNKSLFINTAADFRTYYSKSISRYTFEMLRSLIEDIEIFAILPMMGQDQFDDLKDGVLNKDLSEEEDKLIPLIGKVVAHFTIEEAFKRHWIQIDGNKIVQVELLDSQSYEKQGVPTREKLSLAIRHADEYANRHTSILKKFLTDNIDDYPLYKAYIEAKESAEETTELTGEDCCERDECDTYLTSKSKRKGIVRL